MAAALGTAAIALACSVAPFIERHAAVGHLGDFMGRISYAIYLFQLIAVRIVDERMQGLPLGLRLAAMIAMLVGFCTLFYLYFERPILDARPAYGRRSPEPAIKAVGDPISATVRPNARAADEPPPDRAARA